MLQDIFKAILVPSLIGSALAILLTIIKPITKKYFVSTWHYYMWVFALVIMILPIRITIPEERQSSPEFEIVSQTDNESIINDPIQVAQKNLQLNAERESNNYRNFENLKSFAFNKIRIFSFIWLIGMLLFFICKLAGYMLFLLKLRKYSNVVSCPEIGGFTNKKIVTRTSDKISSPLMIGLFKPTLLLPKTSMTKEQLSNVLAHEMTHFRRKDILCKWFVVIAKCVHWFNPISYYISKQVDIECEISCDLSVVKGMNKEQETNYIDTIITLLTAGNRRKADLTTGMTGDLKVLKRRFTMIKNRKKIKKSTRILSLIVAVILLILTLFTSGVLATTVLEQDSNIQVICNGKLIELDNKPFYENETAYIPLREILDKIGIMRHKNSSIKWENGRIIANLAVDDEVISYDGNGQENGTKTQTLNYCYALEINKAECIINPKESLVASSKNPAYKAHLSARIKMENPPLLKNNITYVPYEYIDRMLGLNMAGLGPLGVDGPYDITCVINTEYPVAYVTPGFFWPVQNEIHGSISKAFGLRVHPITMEQTVHNGVDTIAKENSQVSSAIRGKVSKVGLDKNLGNYVIVENKSGVSTLYGHLSSVDVKEGDYLHKRAVIGKVGRTGTATGAFLHFEIKINGKYYDPLKFWPADMQKDEIIDDNKEKTSTDETKTTNPHQANSPVEYKQVNNTEKQAQLQNELKIKSGEVSGEPYTGFEHLVLKNADTEKIKQELNKQGISETKEASVDLTKNYVVKNYNTNQTKVKSDKNGNITLYFSVNMDNLFDVCFYDAQTNEDVGSFGVLANNENAYTFIGFEKGKDYNVEVRNKTENDWNIEGNYIIY